MMTMICKGLWIYYQNPYKIIEDDNKTISNVSRETLDIVLSYKSN